MANELRTSCIDFYDDESVATFSGAKKKLINKLRKYANQYPDEVQILHENDDGSILAKFPLSYLKITRPRQYTDEERAALAERLAKRKG